jgi:hypothetical protein
VDTSGKPLLTSGAVSGITLGARTPATDPLFDATDPTNGGGDTGSVLISPYIRPGSVSKRFYNHYSWLRTMEDLFSVARRSRGLDRNGHIGYAAQRGLAPFGPDVFTNALGRPIHLRRTTNLGAVARASSGHPRLAVQGDTVSVALSHGRALAQATGPAVSRHSPLAVAATTPCTFKVTLTARSGTVPLSAAAFTIVDEQGHVHHPLLATAGGVTLPRRLAPGRSVTLIVKAALPVGGGRIAWAPTGARPLVAWDFDVELD